MTNWDSETARGARISATVKWYDSAKGYGFLEPPDDSPDDSPDIFCRKPALVAVGLDVLLAGATVDCETMQGHRGPEVSRIRAVDFSTASPNPAAGNESRAERPGPAQAAAPVSGRRIRALVKWFTPDKGYGFLEPEDGSADVFCHLNDVQASGHETLPEGAAVTCEVVPGDKGPQVSRILDIDVPAARRDDAINGRPGRGPRPGRHDAGPGEVPLAVQGTVKFYDTARGYGFIVPDGGGREVFVHASVLVPSGLGDLQSGQRLRVRAEEVPRGLQATEIEPI
jgi:CspA family cold shock protein